MHAFSRMITVLFLPVLITTVSGRSLYAAENGRILPHETVQIIVTTNEVTIGTNFTGIDLFIAGVLENSDPLVRRQGRYDIIVTMESPARPMIMRKKERRMGVWVNADSLTFFNVPLYYALTSTRELRDITVPETYNRLGLGIKNLPLRSASPDKEKTAAFRKELVRLKTQQHLYSERTGAIAFGSPSLFSTRFPLPANTPVGNYIITAYLFRDSSYVDEVSTRLEITKEHLAYSIFRAAHRYSFRYGIAAVIMAIIVGFTGRLLFRRD